ncbi:hypothetical protein BDY24DRAFT_388524 [Mrakia frigida]|uniref:uncharacterized protein n=1 Tax=Mrakia frigida TaxID=29902 RepID=UPI003FCBFEF4
MPLEDSPKSSTSQTSSSKADIRERAEEARRYKEKMKEQELVKGRAQQSPPKGPRVPVCIFYRSPGGCVHRNCPYPHSDPQDPYSIPRLDPRPPPQQTNSRSSRDRSPPSTTRSPSPSLSRSPRRHDRISSTSSSGTEYGPRRPASPLRRSEYPRQRSRSPARRPRSPSPPSFRRDRERERERSRSPSRRTSSSYLDPPPRPRSPLRRTTSNNDRTMPPPPPPLPRNASAKESPHAGSSRTGTQGSPAHPADRGRAVSSEASRSGVGGGREDARRELGLRDDGTKREGSIHPDRRVVREGSSSSSCGAGVKVDEKGKGREVPMDVDHRSSDRSGENCMAVVEELLTIYTQHRNLLSTLTSEESSLSDLQDSSLPPPLKAARTRTSHLRIADLQTQLNLLSPQLQTTCSKLIHILSSSISQQAASSEINRRFVAHKKEIEEKERLLGERFERLEGMQKGWEEERKAWREERREMKGKLDKLERKKMELEGRVEVLEGQVKAGLAEGVGKAMELNRSLDGFKKEVEAKMKIQTTTTTLQPTGLTPFLTQNITTLVSTLLASQPSSNPATLPPTPLSPNPSPSSVVPPPSLVQKQSEPPIIFSIDGKPCSDLAQALRFLASALESFAGEINGRFGVLEGQVASFRQMLDIGGDEGEEEE